MTERLDPATLTLVEGSSSPSKTPGGMQSTAALAWRRALVAVLNVVTWALLGAAMAWILSAGGWSLLDGILLTCFFLVTPWVVLGFWNAAIGLWLLHGRRDGLAEVAPFAGAGTSGEPVFLRTAVLMTLRNEDPARAFARLAAVAGSIARTGQGHHFGYFVLSDTSLPEIAVAEEEAFAAFRASLADGARAVYRRREDNVGYKAGNLRDFCARWGNDYELMLPLDADSLMAGETILAMVRMMQAHPRLGILQSLVTGLPAASGFARIFQFGMRHGMRAYTMGSAWWTGDCGPFWGHNALVRIAPYRDECRLPVLSGRGPLSGAILSHDQLEAALMRRAGYEVRVLPVEVGSWEENPPTVVDFVRRDLRWCLGNMQYIRLLALPGLHPVSRIQLLWATLMFAGLPAMTAMVALSPLAVREAQLADAFPTTAATALYGTFLFLCLFPKLAGLADIALRRDEVARYGGAMRFGLSACLEIVFSFLQGAVSSFRTSLFMAGLLAGRAHVGWNGQERDAHALSWVTAAAGLWPQTVFGLVVCGALAWISPAALLWSLPLTAGYLLAIPFAVVTARPAFGAFLARHRLCAVPEEFDEPAEIAALARPAPPPVAVAA